MSITTRIVKLTLSLVLAAAAVSLILALRPAASQAQPPAPRPVSAWGRLPVTRTLDIGAAGVDTRTFYATDFQTYDCFSVQAALEYTGTHSYVYVDTTQPWARSLVTATATAFDGFWDTLVMTFGLPPDHDGQPRFTLLLMDIRDQYYHDPYATSYIPAYFDPINEAPGACSNNRDMIYVDINPTSPAGLDGKRGMAHSLVNAIGWQADPAEELWLAESLAYLGEYIAGLGHRPEVAAYLANSRNPLTGDTGGSGDAGQEYLWGLYLYQQYGPTAIYNLTQSSLHGMAAVGSVTGDTPANIYHRWTLANMVDAAGATPYGYAGLDIVAGAGNGATTFTRPPATNVVMPPPTGYPGAPPYQRPAGLDLSGTFQGVGYYATDYYRLWPQNVPVWIVDASDYQPFGQSVYSDAVTAAANWTKVITLPAVITGSSVIFAVAPARSTNALGTYRYQLWPMFPPWWPGWDSAKDSDGDCIPDYIECPDMPCRDSDADDTPDYLDADSDNDGLLDRCEYGSDTCPATGPARDTDADGQPDYRDPDDDGDGIPTKDEIQPGQTCATAADCNRDGVPDYRSTDSDGDGLTDGSDPVRDCVNDCGGGAGGYCYYLPIICREYAP